MSIYWIEYDSTPFAITPTIHSIVNRKVMAYCSTEMNLYMLALQVDADSCHVQEDGVTMRL